MDGCYEYLYTLIVPFTILNLLGTATIVVGYDCLKNFFKVKQTIDTIDTLNSFVSPDGIEKIMESIFLEK